MINLKEKAQSLKLDIPAVYLALKKKGTPLAAKILALITVAYALSPIDLIPDFIPVLGFLDDIILLPMMIALTVKLLPKDVFAECRKEAENLWQNGKPKKWYFSIPILLIWIVLLFFVLKYFGFIYK